MKSWTVKHSPKRGKKHYHHVHPCSVAALDKPCCHIFFCWSQACFTFCKWRVLTINGCFALWKYQTEKSTWWMSNFRRCAYLWRIAFFGHHHHHHQSLNREGCWGTTDDFTTNFLHFSLFSTALWDLANSRPVHSLMLSSHLFLCPPCLLPPFTVPCKMVLARPDEWETWPYHCSLHLFTIVRRSTCGPIACWILAWTSLLVTWSLYEMCSILR